MKRKGTILFAFMLLAIALILPVLPARAESVGTLQTASGAKTFYGEKRSIEFFLPVNRKFDLRNPNQIYVELKKGDKIIKKEYVDFTEEEWNNERIVRKYKMSGAGKYTLWAAGQEISFTVKKASDIQKITPKVKTVEDYTYMGITLGNLDVGTKAKIYRSENGGKFKCIKTVSGESFTDTDIKTNTLYYYKVRYYAKNGSKTYKSKMSKISNGYSFS